MTVQAHVDTEIASLQANREGFIISGVIIAVWQSTFSRNELDCPRVIVADKFGNVVDLVFEPRLFSVNPVLTSTIFNEFFKEFKAFTFITLYGSHSADAVPW